MDGGLEEEHMTKEISFSCKFIVLAIILCLIFCLSSCKMTEKQKYYSQKGNYIDATGRVTYIFYDDDHEALYFEFSELTPQMDDICFKIIGENVSIVQEKGIDQIIKIGDQVNFITAPKYFGDGYVMPIVAISVNGEQILSFEEGFSNFQKWLEK